MNYYFAKVLLLGFLFLGFVANPQVLHYSRITSGLQTPEFEGGRSDFRMDDINMDVFWNSHLKTFRL